MKVEADPSHLVHFLQESTTYGVCVSKVSQLLSPIKTEIRDLAGICNALSEHYLTQRIQGSSFPRATNELQGSIQSLKSRQINTQDDQVAHSRGLLERAPYNLKEKANPWEPVAEMAEKGATIALLLSKSKVDPGPAYSLIYMRSHGEQNHVCAAVLYASGAIEYFDPNIGVFRFEAKSQEQPRGLMKKWFASYWDKFNYGRYTAVDILTFVRAG